MPKPRPRAITARPMRPAPTTPSTPPATRTPRKSAGEKPPVHRPARRKRSLSGIRRAAASRRPKARSAVASVSTSGVLQTAIPSRRAASTSGSPGVSRGYPSATRDPRRPARALAARSPRRYDALEMALEGKSGRAVVTE